MFRFFRKDNLKSSRRRSASCPNLQQSLSKEVGFDGEYLKEKPVDDSLSSESETDESNSSNNIDKVKDEWFKASNKENKNNGHSSQNLLCMDDYLSKLPELKLWLKEQGKKDVDTMKTAKLKSHFKVFIKLWNKKKLAPKYYTDELFNSLVSSNDLFQPALEENSKDPDPLLPLPPLLDMSIDHTLDDDDGSTGSPFSTFGKVPDDPKNSPALLAQQISVSKVKDKTMVPPLFKQVHSPSSSKFATILRSTPVASLFKTDSSFPRSSKLVSGVKPVSSPQCPQQPPNSWVTPIVSSLKTVPQPANKDTKDFHKWIDGWNRFTNQSPIYDTVADSIHVNKESPVYSEVTPCGQIESGYCSLSPFKSQKSPSKCVATQPSLNRRRSKSLEDIYSISAKFNHVGISRRPISKREEDDVAEGYAPPIPERNYSPVKLLSPKHSFNKRSSVCNRTPALSTTSPSPSTVKADLFQRLVGIQEISPKKRRSEEGDEMNKDSTSPIKKTKPEPQSANDPFIDEDSFSSISDPKLVESTPVLSILTGSMNPTTRSRYKFVDSDDKNLGTDAVVLNPLQLQQLEESPKLPRRRLKRRSSSFSTTPGKGLTFGKSSKLTLASPRRKVSFAKDVKDPEGDGTSMRRSSSRPGLTSNQINYTKQTKDRKEFEAFLSSHTSPKKVSSEKNNSPGKDVSPSKRSSPNKSGSAGKITSPGKAHTPGKDFSPGKYTSPHKVVSPGKVDTTDKISANKLPSPQQLVAGHGKNDDAPADLMSTQYQSLVSQSRLPTDEEMLFPTSPTRQLGRRVLGKPTSSSYRAKMCLLQADKFFVQPASPAQGCPVKKCSPPKRVESQLSLALPKKTISSLVSKLTEKTVTICAKEMSESEGYSSSEDLLSTAACLKTNTLSQFELQSPSFRINSETSESLYVSIAAVNMNNSPCAVNKNQPNKSSVQKECLFTNYSKDGSPQMNGIDAVNTTESHYCVPNPYRGLISTNCPGDQYNLNKTLVKAPSMVKAPSTLSFDSEKNQQDTIKQSTDIQKTLNSISSSVVDQVITNTQLEEFEKVTGMWYAAVGSKILKENINGTSNEENKDSPHYMKESCDISTGNNSSVTASLDSESEHQLYKITGSSKKSEDSTTCTPDRGTCHLERMHSIRPSPKITEDDGWVTQRRSSRGTRKSPFLSTSSKSSSLEEEESTEVKLPSQEIIYDYPVTGIEPEISPEQPVQENTSSLNTYTPDGCSANSVLLTGILNSSPQKVKPPVMPKPMMKPKPSVLAARGGINLMKPTGHLTTSTKRRSSLNKNGNSSAKPHHLKEDYIQKNINAVGSGKLGISSLQKMSNQPGLCVKKQPNLTDNVTRRRSKTVQLDSSSVTTADRRRSKTMTQAAFTASSVSRRNSKMGAQNATLGLNTIRRRSKTTVPEMENSDEQTKSLAENRRRRSRTSNQNNENAVPSFAARRNFFQQFQAPAHVRPGTCRPINRPGDCNVPPSKLNGNLKEVPSSSPILKTLTLETKRKVKCEIETEI